MWGGWQLSGRVCVCVCSDPEPSGVWRRYRRGRGQREPVSGGTGEAHHSECIHGLGSPDGPLMLEMLWACLLLGDVAGSTGAHTRSATEGQN